ncbi:MAG: glycosyltransferase family 39 protein [Chloroflexota bacterium]
MNTNNPPRLKSVIQQYSLIFWAVLLLLLAASRFITLHGLELNTDEVWSIWQSFGTPEQIIRWTPYDWPPGYYLLLGGWKIFVGIQPIVYHVLSIFIYLISVALLYRVIRRLRDEKTALLVILAYSALGYILRISTEVRAYILMMALLILAFWWVLRYFNRPTIGRAIFLAVTMAAAFYVYLPSVVGFAMIGIYTLIVYPRKIWRWLLPGIIALALAAPLIISKLDDVAIHVAGTDQAAPQTLAEGVSLTFNEFMVFKYANYPVEIWTFLFAAATLIILLRRKIKPMTWAFFAWAVGLPVLIYLVNPWLKFDGHHSMALMIGFGIWVGWGLAYLPRKLMYVAALFLLGLSFFPFNLQYGAGFVRPLLSNFEWLSQRLQPDDVVLIDPKGGVEKYYEWDYASKLFFPNGLHFVTDPTGYRRVWYVTVEGHRDPATDQAVRAGRVEREFVGPSDFFFRLYEAPPDPVGILFDNGMRFHGMDILKDDGHIALTGPLLGQHDFSTVHIRLWWSVDRPPIEDYSVGTYLFFRGGVVDQVDGAPHTISLEYPPNVPPPQTSQWTPGHFYIEDRDLHIPDIIGANKWALDIIMAVYQSQDNTRISAPGVDKDNLLRLKRFYVETW